MCVCVCPRPVANFVCSSVEWLRIFPSGFQLRHWRFLTAGPEQSELPWQETSMWPWESRGWWWLRRHIRSDRHSSRFEWERRGWSVSPCVSWCVCDQMGGQAPRCWLIICTLSPCGRLFSSDKTGMLYVGCHSGAYSAAGMHSSPLHDSVPYFLHYFQLVTINIKERKTALKKEKKERKASSRDFWKYVPIRYSSSVWNKLYFLALWCIFIPYKVIFTLCLPWQQLHWVSVGCWNGLFVAHERNESERFSADVYSLWRCLRQSPRENALSFSLCGWQFVN